MRVYVVKRRPPNAPKLRWLDTLPKEGSFDASTWTDTYGNAYEWTDVDEARDVAAATGGRVYVRRNDYGSAWMKRTKLRAKVARLVATARRETFERCAKALQDLADNELGVERAALQRAEIAIRALATAPQPEQGES